MKPLKLLIILLVISANCYAQSLPQVLSRKNLQDAYYRMPYRTAQKRCISCPEPKYGYDITPDTLFLAIKDYLFLNSNLNNTSDLLKPLSIAAINALALKANLNAPTFTGNVRIDGNLNFFNGATKIIGFDDPTNYYIGNYPVTGNSGLDLHWNGGIRLGDGTGNVVQIQTGNVSIGTTTNNGNKLQVNGNSSFTGNVGIGTTAPSEQLEVAKSIVNGVGGRISIANTANRTDGAINVADLGFKTTNSFTSGYFSAMIKAESHIGSNLSDLAFRTYDAAAIDGTEKMRIKSNGNVGIGITDPDGKLAISAGGAITALRVNGQGGTMLIDYLGTGYHYLDGNYQLWRTIGGVEKMRLDVNSGSLMIGTSTNSGEALQVAGNIKLQTANSGILLTAPNGTVYKLTVSNAGAAVFTAQ